MINKRNIFIFLLIGLIFSSANVFSLPIDVQGVVVDKDNNPIGCLMLNIELYNSNDEINSINMTSECYSPNIGYFHTAFESLFGVKNGDSFLIKVIDLDYSGSYTGILNEDGNSDIIMVLDKKTSLVDSNEVTTSGVQKKNVDAIVVDQNKSIYNSQIDSPEVKPQDLNTKPESLLNTANSSPSNTPLIVDDESEKNNDVKQNTATNYIGYVILLFVVLIGLVLFFLIRKYK